MCRDVWCKVFHHKKKYLIWWYIYDMDLMKVEWILEIFTHHLALQTLIFTLMSAFLLLQFIEIYLNLISPIHSLESFFLFQLIEMLVALFKNLFSIYLRWKLNFIWFESIKFLSSRQRLVLINHNTSCSWVFVTAGNLYVWTLM